MTAWTDLTTATAVARVQAAGWHVTAIGDTWTLYPPGTDMDANGAPLGKRGMRVDGGVAALVAFVAGYDAGRGAP